jgi:acyl carrier protein
MTKAEKLEFLQTAIKKLFHKDINLSYSDNLSDLGLDSLDVVELQMYYEETTGLESSNDDVPVTVEHLLALMR